MKTQDFSLSIISFILGILFIIFPKLAGELIIYAISLYIIIKGILMLIKYRKIKDMLILSIVILFLGILLALLARAIISFVFLIAGFCFIAFALFTFYTTYLLIKSKLPYNKVKIIQSIIYLIIGIFFITNTVVAENIIFIIIGILLILSAINDFIIKIKNNKNGKNNNNTFLDNDYIDI